MNRSFVAMILALALVGASGSAWALGVGVGYRLPTGHFGHDYDGGFGADVTMSFPLVPLVALYGDVGYSRFNAKPDGIDDLNVLSFSAGGRVDLGGFYGGAELGYFTDIDEFSVSPLVGMGLGPLDVSARYKLGGDAHWFDLRAAISLER